MGAVLLQLKHESENNHSTNEILDNSISISNGYRWFCSGYMAPEYAMRGHLTDKADVYSYGIVVLEIISARSNTTYRSKDDCFYLLDWVKLLPSAIQFFLIDRI